MEQIANVLTTPKTARQIAKELGMDKHVVNQILYKNKMFVKSADNIPIWTLDTIPVYYEDKLIGYSKPGQLGIYAY